HRGVHSTALVYKPGRPAARTPTPRRCPMLLAATALSGILFAAVVWPLLRRAQREAGEIVPLAVSPAAAVPQHPPVLCRTLRVYFIKPSKYDDRGRVAHFWKGVLPNNTLTVLAALNEAYNRLRGDDGVYVETVIWDEQVDGPVLPATSSRRATA